MDQRGIVGSKVALIALTDPLDRGKRIVLMELLRRGLYLHRFSNKHEYICLTTDPESLVEKARSIIMGMQAAEGFFNSWAWPSNKSLTTT